jgi:thiamine-phosphate pyrophosphorylase
VSDAPDQRPLLCYVTDRHSLASGAGPDELLAPIRHAIAAGINWIQVRERDLPARELLRLVQQAVAAAAGLATKILVNDRLDVALAAGAAGVHLGGESAPVAEVARWCRAGHAPAGFLIGASCHSLDEAQAAERAGADYVFFGPVFATPSKLAFGPPQGVTKLAEVCRGVRIPVLAIGGITTESAAACLRAGAAGLAAIRLFQESGDLVAVAARLRATL